MNRDAHQREHVLKSRGSRRRGRRVFSLRVRILAINMLALLILVAGVLYLDDYQRGLFAAKIDALTTQGEIIAGALGESVVVSEGPEAKFDAQAARLMIGRLVTPAGTRARLFDAEGNLVVDTRRIAGGEPLVQTRELPPPEEGGPFVRLAEAVYQWVTARLPPRRGLPAYHEAAEQHAADYAEVKSALAGEGGHAIRDAGESELIASVAVPVQHFKHVQGALLLSAGTDDIDPSLRKVRFAILEAFGVALAITILLSLYLAGTIARPVRRLAEAAERVRAAPGRKIAIPDFTRRRDEIGDLSGALRAMTEALSKRMDAIERFAADVAHEIKNPLTSVRNAVETANRLSDEEQKRQLMNIILDDVRRLDRLISDILDASRLDAELSRAETKPVDLGRMLATLIEVREATLESGPEEKTPQIVMKRPAEESYVVPGIEDRLVQVFHNLIGNALSFSPPDGTITLDIAREDDMVRVTVDDEGPGIPPGQSEAIFERFYSLRPEGERFGTHSGLGLSISKQIVEAHGGALTAANRLDESGRILGARFVVRLPA